MELLNDEKDVPYVALVLAFNCLIFSGDPDLRGIEEIKVYSPRELFEMLVGKRIE